MLDELLILACFN